mmetsp:Transcript_26806/g.58797  ORF Transcript_26806/g.58797 Transcript_26806/m.58797 type:complete len:607 (-) Transcript_26806:4341-6161(-)
MVNANLTSTLMVEAGENEVPNLGGTMPLESSEGEYQSFLERLIEQSTSEQRGDFFPVSALWNDTGTRNSTVPFVHSQPPMPLSPPTTALKASLVTLAACTFCLMQAGFVWASFLSSSWFDTRLFISISLPSINIKMDQSQLLNSATLGSLFGDLLGADQHGAAIALVLTSLVLPCLCIVCGVAWIVEDRMEQTKIMRTVDASNNNTSGLRRRLQRNSNRYNCCLSPRLFVEYIARIGVSVLFVICILMIGISPLDIEFEDSRFIVVNQIQGGMAVYALGMICCLSVLTFLRLGKTTIHGIYEPIYFVHRKQFQGEARRNLDFECSWDVHSDELYSSSMRTNTNTNQKNKGHDDFVDLETPLLQNKWRNGIYSAVDRRTLLSAFEGATETMDHHPTEITSVETGFLPFWKRVVLYELALLSTLLWLPALCLPLFRLEYGGIVSDFMSEVSMSFRLRDIPVELWERGRSAGTSRLMLFLVESNFVLLVFVCPILANLLAIGAWICDSPFRTLCKNILWIIQPCLGTIVFGVAVFVSVPAFETVPQGAIDKFASAICNNFEAITTYTCFTIHAEPSLGLWFLLGEAVALEIFVLLTLYWSHDWVGSLAR